MLQILSLYVTITYSRDYAVLPNLVWLPHKVLRLHVWSKLCLVYTSYLESVWRYRLPKQGSRKVDLRREQMLELAQFFRRKNSVFSKLLLANLRKRNFLWIEIRCNFIFTSPKKSNFSTEDLLKSLGYLSISAVLDSKSHLLTCSPPVDIKP
jgi:hypothetical protein